jgi:hypothetical protein
MTPAALLAVAYGLALLICAVVLEWLSAHTHRRSLRYRTAGFSYHPGHDHWTCPEGEYLLPNEVDHELRLVRYRARARVCNGCPVKGRCTDSARGREIVRPLDPWPHSEAGRFHRVISLMLVALAALISLVGFVRIDDVADALPLSVLLVGCVITGRWLLADLRAHPANFPDPSLNGLRVSEAGSTGARKPSRWASENGTAGEL